MHRSRAWLSSAANHCRLQRLSKTAMQRSSGSAERSADHSADSSAEQLADHSKDSSAAGLPVIRRWYLFRFAYLQDFLLKSGVD